MHLLNVRNPYFNLDRGFGLTEPIYAEHLPNAKVGGKKKHE